LANYKQIFKDTKFEFYFIFGFVVGIKYLSLPLKYLCINLILDGLKNKKNRFERFHFMVSGWNPDQDRKFSSRYNFSFHFQLTISLLLYESLKLDYTDSHDPE